MHAHQTNAVEQRKCNALHAAAPCGGRGELYCVTCDGFGTVYSDDAETVLITCAHCNGQGGHDCHCDDCRDIDTGHTCTCDNYCYC